MGDLEYASLPDVFREAQKSLRVHPDITTHQNYLGQYHTVLYVDFQW